MKLSQKSHILSFKAKNNFPKSLIKLSQKSNQKSYFFKVLFLLQAGWNFPNGLKLFKKSFLLQVVYKSKRAGSITVRLTERPYHIAAIGRSE